MALETHAGKVSKIHALKKAAVPAASQALALSKVWFMSSTVGLSMRQAGLFADQWGAFVIALTRRKAHFIGIAASSLCSVFSRRQAYAHSMFPKIGGSQAQQIRVEYPHSFSRTPWVRGSLDRQGGRAQAQIPGGFASSRCLSESCSGI